MEKAKRTVYYDYLRTFAMFAVVLLHTAASNWHSTDVNSFDWQVFNAYDSIVRWGVPVFVMISGALFLGRNIPTKTIYKKYILRIVIAFFFWSGCYALLTCKGIKEIIASTISGHYHMWFLPMIVGLYMAIPIIKCITENKESRRYFLFLASMFAIVLPTLAAISNDFAPKLLNAGIQAVNDSLIRGLKIEIVLGFTVYFILGYVINNTDISVKQRKWIYILGVIGFVSTIVIDSIVSIKNQTPCKTYYGNHTIGVFLESVSVFVFFKYNCPKSERLNAFVQKLAKYSFGAYLVHPWVLSLLEENGFTTLSFNSIISVPLLAITTFSISMLISAVINRIPILKNYIV